MGREKQDIPGFDDLLFEGRNKEYGAYQLRRKYNRVLFAGTLVASFIGCSAVIIPSMMTSNDEYVLAGGGRFVQVEMENLPPPEEQIYIQPPPPPPEKTGETEVVKYVAPVIVDSITVMDHELVTADEALAQTDVTDLEVYGDGTSDDIIAGEGGSGDGDVFYLVEVMPTFRGGGIEKFREWVNKRTNYPQEAIDAKIRGTVFLTFVVEKDGSVTNVIVLKGVHPLLDNEAVKAISESPKWSPGLQRGQPVRIRYQIPMSFIL